MTIDTQPARAALARALVLIAALFACGLALAQTNVALSSNGGVASASSVYNSGYPAAGANNGDRKGLSWSSGGGWNDATSAAYPDWLQVNFSAAKSIAEIDVFTVQDNYASPAAPTATMTFAQYGIVDFQVQYWNGSAWVTVPGGGVTGNNLVWRKFTFAPITTNSIRIYVTNALNGYSRIVEVEAWTAAANTPPTVALTAPANGAGYTAPATVALAATAADPDGSIAKVEFYRGSTLINTDTAAPFSYSDAGLAVGSYSYTAKATDNLGAVTTSAAVSVTVTAANTPPTVSLTAPANGAGFTTPATVNLAATAADTDGTIAKVEFYRGSTLLKTVTAAPYSYSDPGLAVGTYTYTAKAYDNLGAVATSAAVAVSVNSATPQPLSVSLSGAGAGTVTSNPAGINCGTTCVASFTAGTAVTLTATPTGSAGFGGWIGACSGTASSCTVSLDQARAVDAAFVAPTTTTLQYDANGNLTQIADPLNHIRKTNYDALDRPYQVLEPHAVTAGATGGQITTAYDGQDQTATLTDPRNLSTAYTIDGLGNLLTLASPDTGSSSATYDPAGNLKTRTDARGITVTYTYDAVNRLSQIAYGDQTVTITWDNCANGIGRLCKLTDASGITVTYTYDAVNRLSQIAYGDQTVTITWDNCANGIGRLCKLTDASGSTAYAYTSQGRISTKTQTIGSLVLTTRYGYDSDGRVSSLTTPAGKVIGYDWSDGKMNGLRLNGIGQLAAIAYRPFGPIAGWTWSNGQTVIRHYDQVGRLKSISLGHNALGQPDSRGLAYDAGGRLIALVDGLDTSLNQSHGYDGLDRLTGSRLTTASLATYAYGYDLAGNRSSRTLNGVTTTYATATTSNRLQSLSGGQAKAYGYDNAGNITSDGSLSFGYDNAGRRTWSKSGSVTTTYAYNALGQRVKKVGANGTTLYAYDEAGQLIGEYDASGTAIQETVWLQDIPVLTIRGSDVYYVHADHLNTPRRITRPADNKPVWMWEAEPFGNSLPDQNPAGMGNFVYNLRMPGQVYDQETGLFYNWHRNLDPATGRYYESDPIGLEGGINTYTYALNNPLNYTDPFGLTPPSEKIDGTKIQVHKNDVDPWPSQPHGHDYDNNQVVDKDGNIYDKNTRKIVGKLTKKGLQKWLDFLKRFEGKMCAPLMIDDLVDAFCRAFPEDGACMLRTPVSPDAPCAGIPYCT